MIIPSLSCELLIYLWPMGVYKDKVDLALTHYIISTTPGPVYWTVLSSAGTIMVC